MELTFKEESIPCLLSTGGDIQDLEAVQEVKLPESMPDIGSILGCWGQMLIRGKEWHTDRVSCNGGVLTWVLYAPEDGSSPRMVECWIPMQCKWELPAEVREGTASVRGALKGVDARSVSARKIMARASVAMESTLHRKVFVPVWTPEGLPEDVQVLMQTYPMELPVEAGERMVTLDDDVHIPGEDVRILNYRLIPKITDQKLLGQRLVFRGNGLIRILYQDGQGNIRSLDTAVPFSQFAELDGEFSPDARAQMDAQVTNLEIEKTPEGNYRIKGGMVIQYTIYDKMQIQVAEDAYSPFREVTQQKQKLELPAVLDRTTEILRLEQTIPEAAEILDVAWMHDLPRVRRDMETAKVEISSQMQALYLDPEGKLGCHTGRCSTQREYRADDQCRLSPSVEADMMTEVVVAPDGTMLRPELQLQLQTVSDSGINMVQALETGEVIQPDPERPSVILRRAGNRGLWELAKDCRSTVEAIQKANDLIQEPAPDRFLLIPVL